MRCRKCGAELAEDVTFCRECGEKVKKPSSEKRFCRECGAEAEAGAKFCTSCGADLSAAVFSDEEEFIHSETKENHDSARPGNQRAERTSEKSKGLLISRLWRKLDTFEKIVSVSFTIPVIFLLVAIFAKKPFAIVVSVLQLCGLAVSFLMHRGVIMLSRKWIKYLIAAVSVMLIVPNVFSYTSGRKPDTAEASIPAQTEPIREEQSASVASVPNETATGAPTEVPSPAATPEPTEAAAPTDTPVPAEYQCQLFLEIDFDTNVFFSTYNVELYLDDQYVATMPHGTYYTTLLNVQNGRHSLSFKEENGSVRASADFEIKTDSTYTCRIKCHSSRIDVTNKHLSESIHNTTVSVPDTVGMLYSEAVNALKQVGLTNVSYETVGDHWIWDDDNWLVQSQNVAAGTEVFKSEIIRLVCISMSDYFKNAYVGKNVSEIQKLVEKDSFSVRFEDLSGTSMDDQVKTMDAKAKEDWIATDARQFTGADRTAVVIITFRETPAPATPSTDAATATPKATKKPESAHYHSSDNRDVAAKGNSGVFAYKMRGKNYDQYYIIDFDEGYVYYFCYGNGDSTASKVKIVSGDLNSRVLITWHDGDSTWNEGLRFHFKNKPDSMILEDSNHNDFKYTPTDLDDALLLLSKKEIFDY